MARRTVPVTNLPVERGAFVGRSKLLDEVSAAVSSGARLVTLVGPEGIGKTRLALRTAARELKHFTGGGVLVVDVVDATDEAAVARAVAEALDLEPQAAETSEEAVQRLGRALPTQGPLFLVLDGCDAARAAVARLVATWSTLAPEARFLVTSRRALDAPDERVVVVTPLKLPKQSQTDPGAGTSSESVELFLERAKEARRGYAPDARELSAITRIVRLLEGVPLAIEIAAARVRALSAGDLLERLPRNVALLAAGSSVSQRSALAGAVAWSLDLLHPWEQTLLRQCAVFHGGFDLDAARAVVDTSGDTDAPSIEVALESLVEKSLLRIDEPRAFPGEARWSEPNVVRELAARQLEERGERDAVERRHGAHYLKVGGGWAAGTDGHGGLALRRRLELESENVLASVRRALSTDPQTLHSVSHALQGVLALEPVLFHRGPLQVLEELLDRALGPADVPADAVGAPHALRAQVLELRARARRLRGRMAESKSDLDLALALARAARDGALEGRIRGNIGTNLLYAGDTAGARAEYDAAIALLHEASDRRIEARSIGFFGLLEQEEGRPEEAKRRYDEAIRLHKEVGDRRYEAIHLGQLGSTYFVLGRLEEARACLKKALALHREIGNRRHEGVVLGWLGDLAFEQGSLDEARNHHESALAAHKAMLDRRGEGLSKMKLGHVLLDQGDAASARRYLLEALGIHRDVKNRRGEGLVLGALAAIDAAQGDVSQAREAMADAKRLLGPMGDPHLAQVLDLYSIHVERIAAKKADADGNTRVARPMTTSADPTETSPGVEQSEEVRAAMRTIIALRMLRRR